MKQGQFLLQVDPRNVRNRLQVSEAIARAAADLAAAGAPEPRERQGQPEAGARRTGAAAAARPRQAGHQAGAGNGAGQRGAARPVTSRTPSRPWRPPSSGSGARWPTCQSAQHDLSRVTIEAPIDGIVTKRNVEEGEMAVVGFTNNPSVVLLIVADMSVIEAEIEVDETDIPNVKFGQKTKVTIDALPDRDVHRQGDRDRQQPDQRLVRVRGRRPAGHELQGRGHPRRRDPRGPARVHLHGRHHDGRPRERRVGARSRR